MVEVAVAVAVRVIPDHTQLVRVQQDKDMQAGLDRSVQPIMAVVEEVLVQWAEVAAQEQEVQA